MDTMKSIVFSDMPIPVLTCSGTPELALHQKGSYGYLSASSAASSAASSRTSPAPSPGIRVTYAG